MTKTDNLANYLDLEKYSLPKNLQEQILRLNALPSCYRHYLRRKLHPLLETGINELAIQSFMQPFTAILDQLKSYQLHLYSKPAALRATSKRYKINALKLVTQSNEKVLNHLRQKLSKKIVHHSTLLINKNYKSETENGLKKMMPKHGKLSLYDLSKQAEKRLNAELVERIKGLCGYYQDHLNYYALSVVITPSSKHHPYDFRGEKSKLWEQAGSPTPLDTYQMMQKSWKKVRARCAKQKILLKGLMTPEPNQQGVPHLNFLLFFPSKIDADAALEIMHHVFLKDDPDQIKTSGFSKSSSIRIFSNPLEHALAWGLYITKNHRVDTDHHPSLNLRSETDQFIDFNSKVDYERVRCWHETWGIRRYNFFGQKPIYFWREIQQISSEMVHHAKAKLGSLPSDFTALWQSASGKVLHSQGSTFSKYSYRDFLMLTEPEDFSFKDSIHHLTPCHTTPSIILERRPYPNDPQRFFLLIHCTADPKKPAFLYKRNDLVLFNQYLESIEAGKTHVWSRFKLQLFITLLKNDPPEPDRSLWLDFLR